MSATTACPKTRAFQLRVNPLTGDSEWIVVEEGGDREELEEKTSKNLLATTSYLDMLNDSYRNWAFRAAIEKTIKKPCHVLDIGAGTGLLSMMAARTMAKFEEASEAKVSACESYLPMGKLMRRVLRKNQMEKKVSEILDSELLGEGLIPTLQQAHDMLLAKNPQTVPYRATTYGQLSEPFKIFEFDFWKKPESHGEIEMSIKACSDGNVIAVISWWVLQLDEEGSIFYSTAPRWTNCPDNGMVENCIPGYIVFEAKSHRRVSWTSEGNENWCDHWKQCVWFISGAGLPVLKDKLVLFKAAYDEIKISYHLKCDDQTCCNNFNFGNCLLELSPERVAVYGDKDWRSGFINAMRNTLNVRSAPLCIIADDSVFLTILISYLSKNANTISSFPGLQEKGAQYLQAIADSNGFSMDRVKVIGKRASYLLTDNLIQQKVDFLVGEPFYYGNEGALPWQNLRFWKERTLLDSILSEDVVIMPCKGILKVCAMSLPDLWRSRCSLKKVEGFDHSVVNETLGACGNLPPLLEGPCLPYYIWQCGEVEELSEILPLMEFNFLEPIHACSRKIKIEFSKLGICHGFALWIDWVLDNKKSLLVSTGPISRYWKQGVKLLSKPLAVNAAYSFAEIEAFFDHSSGEITISSFSPS
ncbi:Protein arginine N-methyltransferase [Musa troglodytarum]|uniref:Protein arginine N-methyltransferase n=1 Tax=Musa troglodytarum TaxID=320322 RepID=A0A9E7GRN4_9LILI|nr:Protein arginine N-methyltransferase [Musa troglodytarum]